MVQKTNNLLLTIMAAFILLMSSVDSKSESIFEKQPDITIDYDISKDSVSKRALALFKDKILREYLCTPSGEITHTHWHLFMQIHDTCFTKNYNIFATKCGSKDAKLFWSLVKNEMYSESLQDKSIVRASAKINSKNRVIGDTIFVTSIANRGNGVIDSYKGTYIFGGNYIDFNNEYVAKYIDEIKQICADMKHTKAVLFKKRKQKAI